ncbi:MAG: polysaccharide deacetylase family protein [Acidobacteriia bacterium]|nr:polysaccharide deacetylase family protein [Terriglobia bacterium]
MAGPRTVFLMYHELELPGRRLCQSDPGYVRYTLPVAEFQAQIEFLKTAGWHGVSVGTALAPQTSPAIAITFDDGCETDCLTAAPLLKQAGFGATFYITTGFLGKPGYMSPSQARQLGEQGFELGCHSMSHSYLTDLDEAGLRCEIGDAKRKLEDVAGGPVEHFSCPGGRYDQRVAEMAREAGYSTVATSRAHANGPNTDRFALGRVAVMRDLSLRVFEGICSGEALRTMALRDSFRNSAKRVLGNTVYDRVRAALLRNPSGAKS